MGQEAAGIALLAFALYSAVSLISRSYSANWGGVVGDYLSGALLVSIGYTSYVLPVLLAVVSVELILRRDFSFNAALPAGFAVFVLSASAFLGLVFGTSVAGGFVGDLVGGLLSEYLGFTGSIIILATVVLISTLVTTSISVIRLLFEALARAAGLIKASAWKAKEMEDAEEGVEDEPVPAVKASKATPVEERRKEASSTPAIIAPKIHSKGKHPEDEEEELEFTSPGGSYKLPPTTLLDKASEKAGSVDNKTLLENSTVLERKLLDFGIEGRVVEVRPGPVVTMYEFEPAPGVKVNKITSLADDLALAMKAMSIRIVAPIPGKSVVGIEVPNHKRDLICLREMLECPAFSKNRSVLSLALGKDISGAPYVADLARMPHLLVAGATGTGKSVSVNAMILSVLFKATPDDVRFVMVDPKMLELSAYEGIPHLITPVITDPKKAAGALRSIVSEMGRRYKLMAMKGAKNIDKYNQMIAGEKDPEPREGEEHRRLPYIVVVIDELADLMMTSGKDVEECLVRLSQMARASGIHLLVATQRPSVDVVTGLVKTNFPARIAFQLPSRTDSRTILDAGGAETLLGEGDMLVLPPGTSKLQRVHGAFVSETEIRKVTDFWKKQGSPLYDAAMIEESESYGTGGEEDDLGEEFLRRYDEAVELAAQMDMISTSYIQRRFRIGYNTAARIIEKMEKDGVVGPSQGSRPREVLLRRR